MREYAERLREKLFLAGDSVFGMDMQEYLKKHDIVFKAPQVGGFEGFPLGNGDMAAMVWTDERRVVLQINKADLWTQPTEEAPMLLRSAGKVSIDFGCPIFDPVQLDGFEMRLSPAAGVLTLTAVTAFAKLEMEMRMLRGTNCMQIQLQGEGLQKVRISLERYGSRGFPFWYNRMEKGAEKGLGNAAAYAEKNRIIVTEGFWKEEDRAVCTSVTTGESGRVKICTEAADRRRAEMEISTEGDGQEKWKTALFICCASGTDTEKAAAGCLQAEKESCAGWTALLQETEAYWNDYWRDTRLILRQTGQEKTEKAKGRNPSGTEWDYIENLYVIQKYMMACGCGREYPMTFNGGTFTWKEDIRQWGNPHHWNTHMIYNGTPGYLNRPEMMEGYVKAYERILPEAGEFAGRRGAPEGILISEMHDFAGRMLAYPGALTPASHIALIFWEHYRFEKDESFLRERAYPFMKAAAEFYLEYAKEESGIFHIYPAGVYECEFGEDFRDTAPDLSAVRALFPACIRAAAILEADEGKRRQWQDFLDRLAPYTYRKNGRGEEVLAVAKDKRGEAADFQEQNETFMRNCAPVYPWNVTGIRNRGERLYEAAVHALPDYRMTAAAISPTGVVYARLGFGGERIRALVIQAIRQLQHFPQGLYYNIDHWCQYSRYFDREKNFITAQRDYIYDEQCCYHNIRVGEDETGTELPMRPFAQCGFETPAILMMALHESALQSHEDVIRIFPVTDLFGDCAFRLKARGGFMVSALQRNGKVVPAVLIKSLYGGSCRLDLSVFDAEAVVYEMCENESMDGFVLSGAEGTFTTKAGREYLIVDGKLTEWEDKWQELAKAGKFAVNPGENQHCKHMQEAQIGREAQFGL